MSLDAAIDTREIVICVGSGGVGKTTIAASIALAAARAGKKTLVLTIDPARRLANAMGLEGLDNVQTRIDPALLKKAGVAADGELWGMMLDMKRTWDELIGRIAPTTEQRDRILNNPYYQSLSSAIAGSQEYMAMEKLLEIHGAREYDLIVLDTPPTKHAMDFLEAPRRMSDFLEGKVIQTLLKPYAIAGKAGFSILKKGTTTLMGLVEKVTGVELLRDLAEFFLSFEGLYDGFKDRAMRVNQLLRSHRTEFFLVAAPYHLILRESQFFADKLTEFRMPLGAVIFNRVHPSFLPSQRSHRSIAALCRKPDKRAPIVEPFGDEKETYDAVLQSLCSNFLRAQRLADADAGSIDKFMAHYPGVDHYVIPFFDTDVHDLTGLARVGSYLFEHER